MKTATTPLMCTTPQHFVGVCDSLNLSKPNTFTSNKIPDVYEYLKSLSNQELDELIDVLYNDLNILLEFDDTKEWYTITSAI